MHFRFYFDVCPVHSPFGFVHLTHQNLSVRTLFYHNSIYKLFIVWCVLKALFRDLLTPPSKRILMLLQIINVVVPNFISMQFTIILLFSDGLHPFETANPIPY